jgi:hypothetical protein
MKPNLVHRSVTWLIQITCDQEYALTEGSALHQRMAVIWSKRAHSSHRKTADDLSAEKFLIIKIAEKHKVPRTTYEEHLRKAESKILRAIAPYVRMYASDASVPGQAPEIAAS